eukprot:TRINITY_DN11327_c0_g1_i1.p2 TRINITY_DN11327_c0_g1~~TRINITY_DN11327_c0_g1_i1.p2  ORF type:complete len:236 (-),score=22.73 TRINITY_DN11327_c0_g1_i1:22-684(-)
MLQQNNIDLSALLSSQQLLERNPLADLSARQMIEWSKLMQCLGQMPVGGLQPPLLASMQQQQQQQQFIKQQQQQQQLLQQQQKLPQVQIPKQISSPMKINCQNQCVNNASGNNNNNNCSRMKTFVCANQKQLQFPRELKHSIIHIYIAKKIQFDIIQGKKLKNNNNVNTNNNKNNTNCNNNSDKINNGIKKIAISQHFYESQPFHHQIQGYLFCSPVFVC